MTSIFDVAAYVLDKLGVMTTMKLEKLCWPFAVWCGWVCQVVTVLRSSLPQVR